MDYVDRILVEKTLLGERNAFAELVELYKDKIYNYLFRLTGSREDAEDLAQETFLRAYSRLDTFDTGMRFSPWLYRIAHNAATDLLRRRNPTVYLDEGWQDEQSGPLWQLQSSEPGPEETVAFMAVRDEVQAAILALPVPYRSVLLLRYTQEMSYEDMSRTLEMPVTTVKTRLHRAREALRRSLQARGIIGCQEESSHGM